MEKISFPNYTDKQKKIMQNVLMYSPLCWKDGNFKFDRDKQGNCNNQDCSECLFRTFDLTVNK